MILNEQIIIFILAILVIGLLVWVSRIEFRMRKIFKGKKANNLEETIISLINELKNLEKSKDNIIADVEGIEKRLQKSIQGVGIVRFKPFRDSGGNQSFSIVLINEKGDGIVLSSLYAREKVSLFAKPLKNCKSDYDLTNEEKEALREAQLTNK